MQSMYTILATNSFENSVARGILARTQCHVSNQFLMYRDEYIVYRYRHHIVYF